jgi:hypothetical protein
MTPCLHEPCRPTKRAHPAHEPRHGMHHACTNRAGLPYHHACTSLAGLPYHHACTTSPPGALPPARTVQAYHTTMPARSVQAYHTTMPARAVQAYHTTMPARAVQAYQTALPARHHHQGHYRLHEPCRPTKPHYLRDITTRLVRYSIPMGNASSLNTYPALCRGRLSPLPI